METFRYLPILLILNSCIMQAQDHPQFLDAHQWEHRLVILFADNPQQDILRKQLQLLEAQPDALADRQLQLYQVFTKYTLAPDGTRLGKGEIAAATARQLRKYYGVDTGTFAVLLIGKDGGEKLRQSDILAPQRLFDTIDAMPMRRAEMRRKNE
ncbi:MAG: DUF4174 domain-containing protein [Bacteroidota bacterium]